MRFFERQDDDRNNGSADQGDASDSLDVVRREARGILAAGDEAIRRALAGNSEAFLRASRQQGGE